MTPDVPTTACYDPPAFIATVKQKYGEAPAQAGVTTQGWLSILFVDPGDGSWTLALQIPGGPMCVVTAGDGWGSIAPPPGDPA